MRRWAMVAGFAFLFASGCDDGNAQPADGGTDADADGDADEPGDAEADDGTDAEADGTDGCGTGVVTPGEECDDGNLVSGDGCEPDCTFSCHDDTDCDDGLDCTGDLCADASDGRVCRHDMVTGACLIDGTCVDHDAVDPTRPCMFCDPGTRTDDWTPVTEGASCEDGLFCNGAETCTAEGDCTALDPACPGGCVDSCDESGDSCIPAETSVVCRPAFGGCDLDEKCDGASLDCPADERSAAGFVCRPALGACDPGETCTGTEVDCPADAIVPEGTACDDLLACSITDACNAAGVCVGTEWLAPGAPVPYLPQNGTRTGAAASAMVTSALRPMFRWMDSPWDGCPTPTYELQVDDSCTTPGFASCGFASPEIDEIGISGAAFVPTSDLPVGTTAPVGRRYYWRVRACRGTTCSAWSTVRYLEVGRVPQDFNGDGFSDIAVGAPAQDGTAVDEGAAFVYLGSTTGLGATPATTLFCPDHTAGGGFGFVTAAAGDLNADGFTDLAVGAPTDDLPVSNGGRVFVYLGSATGIPTTPSATLVNPDLQAEGQFGVAVAGAGDVNGDGFDDLVVGAHRQDGAAVDQGAVWMFYGSATGVAASPDVALADPGEQAGAQFGRSVAGAGDLNADGYADVVVGAPYQDNGATDEGAAYVYLGSAAGPAAAPSVSLDNPVNQADAHFGWSVASAGDINVNGYSELLVGAPVQANPTVGEGNVFVYYGTLTGVPTYPSGTFDNPGAQDGGFGFSAAGIGDVNGDVNPDVAIGALYQDNGAVDEGNAFVFNGCYCGVIHTSPPTTTLDNPDDQANALFGQSVSGAGDVNGDGFADLVVGALVQDGAAANEGMVFVYHGSATGLPTTPTLRLADPGDEASAQFGAWVE